MKTSKPSGGLAVMADRREAVDSLDFFPTPPWATRALIEHVIGDVSGCSCWEPAAGAGHMAEVLRESFDAVRASDVHDYGKRYEIGSFVGDGLDVAPAATVDWIITNPPFNLAVEFAERALGIASDGVALLVRTSWLESADRYERLFRDRPPSRVGLFVERVPMVKGRWDPKASTATSYAWIVWRPFMKKSETKIVWIPPGCRVGLTKSDDAAKFASEKEAA